MKREELKEFILTNFQSVKTENLEKQKVEIFRVDLTELAKNAGEILAEKAEELGDFERETFEKILANFEQTEEKMPIFAVLHDGDFPVRLEVKTGAALAKILREKESVVPSKLLSEREWSQIIGFGQVSPEEAKDLIRLSYRLASE
jgi:predicted DNA-binding protein (MmcQ/YjbR family)